jgi:hypothetical protein
VCLGFAICRSASPSTQESQSYGGSCCFQTSRVRHQLPKLRHHVSLDYFECLKFPRPSYSVCAARIRASTKTIVGFEEYSRHLNELKQEYLPLALCFGSNFSHTLRVDAVRGRAPGAQEPRGQLLYNTKVGAGTLVALIIEIAMAQRFVIGHAYRKQQKHNQVKRDRRSCTKRGRNRPHPQTPHHR